MVTAKLLEESSKAAASVPLRIKSSPVPVAVSKHLKLRIPVGLSRVKVIVGSSIPNPSLGSLVS